jgi:HEAT repeat protein
MRHTTFFFSIIACLAVAATVALAAEAPLVKDDIAAAVAPLADYDLGKPHEPVSEVARLIRATAGQPDLRLHLERQLAKILAGPAGDEAKYVICRMLAQIGTEESLPVLAKMLVDEKTAHIACLAVGVNPSPKAGAALREALGAAQGKALVCVIGVLGDRRDQESTAAIGKLAASADPAVVEASLAALGRIGSLPAAEILAKARAGADAKARTQASLALLQCAERLVAAGKKPEAAAIYQELAKVKGMELVRRGAIIGILTLGGPDAVSLALATLRNDNRMMRATAINAIPTLQGDGIAEKFAAELPSQPPAVQALLVEALADRTEAAVRPIIMSAARSQSAEVRLAALKALAKVGDASCVAVLARAAGEEESDEAKRAALVALRNLGGKDVDAAIVASLKAAKPEVRAQLIEILHDRGAAGVVPALLLEAGSPEAAVRAAAFKALGRLAEAKDLPAILEVFVKSQGDAGPEAEGAVVAVSRKVADEGARADAVLAALRTAATPAAKGALLRILKGLATAKALEAVQAALKDSDPQVQQAAVRSLAEWPDARPLAALVDVCRATPSDTMRVVALRGCVRMLGQGGGLPTADTMKAYADMMALAKRPEEKRLVLAALGNVAHPAALAMIQSCMADDAVAAEASLAAVSAARSMMGLYRDEVRAAMTKLAAETKDAETKKQAQQILREIGALGDTLTAWQAAGPYTDAGKNYTQLYETVFPPELPDAKDVAWRVLPVSVKPGKGPAVLNLLVIGEGDNRVAYLRTWVHSAKAQDARIEGGSDDGLKVWLNGKVVINENRGGACVPGMFKADVALRQGANLVFVKVTQGSGPWDLCLRLCGRDGKPLEGIRVSPSRQ